MTPSVEPPQLELFAAIPDEASAVDNLGMKPTNHRARRDGSSDNHRVATSTGTERTVSERAAHDDDALRVWLIYESERARLLGGTARTGAPPLALRALIAEIGVERVEGYTRRSLELAASAVARGRSCAADLIAARSDGREWHLARVEAVERWREPEPLVVVPSSPPPPDPVVDGRRVTRFELDAWESGGEQAVREQREREIHAQPSGVADIEAWLAKHRAGGTS